MIKVYFLVLFAVLAFAVQAQRAPIAINDVATVAENGTVTLNVLANDSNFNQPDSVCITGLYGGPSAWATVQGCTQVIFHPLNPTFVGLDTFYYISCDRVLTNLCDTGRVIVTVNIIAPKAVNDNVTLLEGDSVVLNVLANDTNYNPNDSIRITNVWGTIGWVTILDSNAIKVHPTSPGYFDTISFSYRSCDMHSLLCDTGYVLVNIIRKPIAYTDTASIFQPDTAYIFPIANDSDLNVLDSACVTSVWGVPAGWTSIQGCDQINYAPANLDYAGMDTFYYSSCYSQTPALCDTGMIIVTVTLPLPQIDFEWTEDSPCVAQVYNNSILADSIVWNIQYLSGNGNNETLSNVNQFPLSATAVDSGFDVQVCLTAYNPSGDTTLCYTFWIQCTFGSDGIAELSAAHLSVYPDPASDHIQVDLSTVNPVTLSGSSILIIYDLMGRELKEVPVTEINNPISVSDLSPGIYFISLLESSHNKKMLGKFEVMR